MCIAGNDLSMPQPGTLTPACCVLCCAVPAVQLQEEVYEEAAKHGSVTGVCVPQPPDTVQDLQPGRCYIRYTTPEDAKKGGCAEA